MGVTVPEADGGDDWLCPLEHLPWIEHPLASSGTGIGRHCLQESRVRE